MVAVPTTRHHHGAAWAYLFPPRRAALLRLFRPGVAGAAGALDPRAGPRLAAPAGREPVPQAPSLLPLPLRVRSGPALQDYGIEQQAEIVRHVYLMRRGVAVARAAPLAMLEAILPFRPRQS